MLELDKPGEFTAAEADARASRRGLWAAPGSDAGLGSRAKRSGRRARREQAAAADPMCAIYIGSPEPLSPFAPQASSPTLLVAYHCGGER
jgi:hypothetical protein